MTLDQYISDHLSQPFAWRGNDCVTFAVGWLSIRANKDWLADIPPWTNAKEAIRVVKAMGGLETQFDKHLTRIKATAAKDGDIALIGRTVFIFVGPNIVGPGRQGLIFIDRMNAKCAWSL